MCGEPSKVKTSNIAPTKKLLSRITRRIAHLREVRADCSISGFGIRLSGHFHRTEADVPECDGDDRR